MRQWAQSNPLHRARGARWVSGLVGVLALVGGPLAAPGGAAAAVAKPTTGWGATAQAPCDPLDTSQCMLPFPNDFYTVSDPTQATGRRVNFPPGAFPAAGASAFNPSPWEGNDGFSPGSTILTHVPGISLAASKVATLSDMGDSLAAGSPVVLMDATTNTRWPTWTELDVADADAGTQSLVVHPARNLTEGHRYIVALRNLRTPGGTAIAPGVAFASVLGTGGLAGGLSAAYAGHLRGVVAQLAKNGVTSKGLYLAWDFTVASTVDLTQPALIMRDQTFAGLGTGVGPFRVTTVVDDPAANQSLSRVITGTFDVPSYLSGAAGTTASVLTEDAHGHPVHQAGHTDQANFVCEIPKAATARHPASVGIYGHGLFGSATEVTVGSVPPFSDAYDYSFCGTDWVGLSKGTLGLALSVTSNFGNFPALADNLLQALLNAQVLGHLMENPKGFATSTAFEDQAHRPLIRPSSGLVYYGNSEGGIMGGALTALSTEVHRSVLGVPGMDYAVLLPRSADFTPFQGLASKAYPDRAVQLLGIDVMQMLWDRGDADGYAAQMTGGLPGTPRHQVILIEAFGDHQVANVATETEARTIGAALHEPALAPGRSLQAQPFWDLPKLGPAATGPALFVWDTGALPAPLTDVAPTQGPDPHSTTSRPFPAFWAQMHTFFTTGKVANPCGTRPCAGP